MQHAIRPESLGPVGQDMAAAIQACVHCGFCLPTCPTYRVLREEMDSPRGRIYLMAAALEGRLAMRGPVVEHVDRCLGCLACVTACPSGVRYDHLLTGFRSLLEREAARPVTRRLVRRLLAAVLPYPRRLRAAVRLGQALRPLARRLPGVPGAAVALLPRTLPPGGGPGAFHRGRPPRRARVALLAGCVQQVLAPSTTHAALRVLTHNGVDVLVPAGQGCCGALAMHAGMMERARALARRNLAALWDEGVDAIVVTAAGCGSAMKEYARLFAGQPEERLAARFAAAVRDVAEFLEELGPIPPGPLVGPRRVAYHDACHLAHAQGIREAPRRLLRRIPGLELLELPDPEICCGSAGTYNLEHPAVARTLGRRKAEGILATGAQAVVTGNVGCMLQLEAALREQGAQVPVWHTVELLDRAYGSGSR